MFNLCPTFFSIFSCVKRNVNLILPFQLEVNYDKLKTKHLNEMMYVLNKLEGK